MLQTYPREADYLDLWSDSDLKLLEDNTLYKKCKKNRE